MSAKLGRTGEERDKAPRGRDEWDARHKELDKRYREQENTEVYDLVHAFNLTPEQLGQLLRQTVQPLSSSEAANQVIKKDVTDED